MGEVLAEPHRCDLRSAAVGSTRRPIPLARAASRTCARPGCPAPAAATLTFRYATREAWVGPLSEVADPQRYDLCAGHAARTEPPRGWSLTDVRSDPSAAVDPALDVGRADEPPGASEPAPTREATVALLAAALGRTGEDDARPADGQARLFPDEAAAPAERASAW